ncbi:MAG: hypothetical protein NTV56_00590 [Alphaproteobacteria bacterium]|nr:hypothetical protein [Alphaproteobacteria bacterium]
MSTNCRPLSKIPFVQLFDGRLEKYGVRERISADTTKNKNRRDLVGRDGVLAVYREEDGGCSFTRLCFTPVPWAVLDALDKEFKIEIVTEHQPQYWGFDTEEEWEAFNKKTSKEHEDEFYADLLNYLNGRPHKISRGTVGMQRAKIAKKIVKRDPELLQPKNRTALMQAVIAIYERDHAVIVRLTDQDIASVKMMAARTDDLPKA